jgi:hypothetical protein
MSAGLLVTAVVAYTIALNDATMNTLFHTYNMVDAAGKTVTKFGASGWWWLAAIAQFLMVIVMSSFGRVGHVPLAIGTPLFLAFAALNGIVLAPALYAYTAVSVAKVFLITSITFSGCAIWGWTTKSDMTGMGNFFLYSLMGLLVTLIVNAIFGSPAVDYMISFAAILLFAALTAFDMQMLRKMHEASDDHSGLVVSGALALYLDFINMFLYILRFFGVKAGKD